MPHFSEHTAELARLEDAGLLEHPHTSAGRVPTDRGYRIYVDDIISEGGLPVPHKRFDLSTMRRELDGRGNSADSLEAMDREEVLSDWLESRGIEGAWRIAPALAAADVDTAWCERMAAPLAPEHLEPAFTWVASALSARG